MNTELTSSASTATDFSKDPPTRSAMDSMLAHHSGNVSLSDPSNAMNEKASAAISAAEAPVRPTRPSNDPCVFILGCDRSGTTLVQKMLTSHSQLHITYETGYSLTTKHLCRPKNLEPCLQAVDAFLQFKGVDANGLRDDIESAGAVEFPDLTALVYRRVAALYGKARWGDKTPAYTRHVLSLAMMFPSARFIHVVRDPRAVAVSWVPTNWGPNTYWNAGRWWAREVAIATVDIGILEPWRRSTIRFEDVVREPEQTMRGVCQFLDVAWEPQVLDAAARSAAKLPSKQDEKLHQKTEKDVDPERAVSWRQVDPRRFRHLEAECRELMEYYRYELLNDKPIHPTKFEQARYKLTNRLLGYRNRLRRIASGIRPPKYPLP
jgi:Sulfotransferase family